VIVYHHYNHKWKAWSQRDKDQTWAVLKKYNVIAIFVGHMHKPSRYKWHGIRTYIVPKLATYGYYVCHIDNGKLVVTRKKPSGWKKSWSKTFVPIP